MSACQYPPPPLSPLCAHRIAIEIIKEAARAIEDMPLLTFFPFFPLILGLGYFVIFIVVALYIFSVWNLEYIAMPPHITNSPVYRNQIFTNQSINGTFMEVGNNIPPLYYKYSWDESLKRAFAYAFFHLLWSVQVLIYFCYMVIAGAIANWYFTPRDQKGEKIRGNAPGVSSKEKERQTHKKHRHKHTLAQFYM